MMLSVLLVLSMLLFSAFDTSNASLKEEILQLLSALTLYNDKGLNLTILAFEKYKVCVSAFYLFACLLLFMCVCVCVCVSGSRIGIWTQPHIH